MFRKRKRHLCMFFVYGFLLLIVEYLLVYNRHPHHAATPTVNSDSTPTYTRRTLSKLEEANFLSGAHNESGKLPLKNLTSNALDLSKLHMIQMKLLTCVQSNRDIEKCLEEEYLLERRTVVLDAVKVIKGHENPKTQQRAGKVWTGGSKPLKLNPLKAIAVVLPTDNPKAVEEFYRVDKYTTVVNKFVYDYVITPKRSCDSATYMVILVHSFHPYEDRRRAIRSTWGGAATGNLTWPKRSITEHLKLFFMLGTHPSPAMNSIIQRESDKYDDIIQGNFFDAYVNMTLKSLLGLKYVSFHCSKVQYLLKSDDDMIINIPHMLNILRGKNMTNGIMGPLNKGSKVYRAGKWKINARDYPFRYYPPYESGSAYIVSNDIVAKLYNISHYIRSFHVDDAYITGVLGKMLGVTHVEQPGFAFWTDKPPTACEIATDKKVTGTKMTPIRLEQLWTTLTQGVNCH